MRRIKAALGVVIFCLVLVSVYYVADTTLKYKYADGIRPMMDFYNYPDNSIDVLFIGSSHVGVNIDTEILCNDYGIASYKLWGTTQPPWNTYYYLVEALKTQSPKVVVMETLGCSFDIEYLGDAYALKNVLGMKMSWNKVEAIMNSVPEEYRVAALLSFPTYHTRYDSLEEEDFTSYFWNYEFASQNTHYWYTICVKEEPEYTDEREALGEKELLYINKIINLCEEKGIELIFLGSPYTVTETEYARFNTLHDYLEEKGLVYLDYITNGNYKSIGIDFTTDFGDDSGHLNTYGITKLSNAVGTYLRENYDLPERYNDPYFAYEMPSNAVYKLTEPFDGNGTTDLVDTGIQLYDDPDKDWTVLTKLDPQCDSSEKIYFACFSEADPHRGLMVRGIEGGGLDVIVGDNYYVKVYPDAAKNATLAIRKEGNTYTIYCNGEQVTAQFDSSCEAYDGTLTIGCEWQANGTPGKVSEVYVEQLEVRDEALPEEDILEWMELKEDSLTKEEVEASYEESYTGDLAYTLAEPFKGDGSTCLYTGVQLCYDPDRDWTLLTELEVPSGDTDGVYLSCYAEDGENSRGILVRKTEDTLQVLVGNGQTFQSLLFSDSTVRLAVTKQGDTYEVFANGASLGTAEAEIAPYLAPLVLGAQLSTNYDPYNQSALTVRRLEVREGVLSAEEIMNW